MKLFSYIIAIILIAVLAAFLNLIQGVYYGVVAPILDGVKVNGTSPHAPNLPLPGGQIETLLIMLVGVTFFFLIIYIVKILRERPPY